MKKTSTQFMLFLFLFCTGLALRAQPLTGTKTVGGVSPDYATISLAIDALNSNGAGTGGVTFNVAAGHTEVLANKTITTTTGSAANPIVFRKNGTGANPLITAAAGTSTTLDGIIKISGTDYLTIDGIDLLDPSSNTTTTTQMEWGYALLKASATNGSQHIAIINCTITLQRSNTNTKGIYLANHTLTSTTALTISSGPGTNSYITVSGNVITNTFSGIYSMGATNALYFDDSLNFGYNTITGFGGSSSAYGIYLQNFLNADVSNDSIYNVITPTSSSTYYGIYTGNASNSNFRADNNSIQVTLGGSQSTRGVFGIYCLNGDVGNTITISNNRIRNCIYAATSTLYSMIYTSSNADTYIMGNSITGNVRTGTSGQTCYIYSALNPSIRIISNNIIYGNNTSGTSAKLYAINLAGGSAEIRGNTISFDTCSGTSSATYSIYAASGSVVIAGNTISSIYSSGTSSDAFGIYVAAAGQVASEIYGNAINSLNHASSSTGNLYSVYHAGGDALIYQNSLSGSTTAGSVNTGILLGASAGADYKVFQNRIVSLTSSYNSCVVTGIDQSGLNSSLIHNNIIGSLTSGSSTTTTNGINGINVSSGSDGTVSLIYFNTIYLAATSTGGTNGVLLNTASQVNMANNIIINISSQGTTATRAACAIKRSSTTFASYSASSNNNFLSVGPSTAAYRYIYYDGSNSFANLTLFQNYALTRDQSSLTGTYYFKSTSPSSPDFLKPDTTFPSFFESSGKIINGLFHDHLRSYVRDNYPLMGQVNGGGTYPDLGAFEMDMIPNDSTGPEIIYTPLGKCLVSSFRTLENVMINDPSGVNTASGHVPRLYFKKSTHANTLASVNNSTADGWKYVESYSGSSPYLFMIDYSLLYGTGSVSAGDVIQYFVVAEDNAPAHNVRSKGATLANIPASGVALTSASFPVVVGNSYNVYSTGLPSLITVGTTSADYSSLTLAGGLFDAINNGLVTGNITVLVKSDLISETGAVPLNKFAEDGFGAGTFTITIQPINAQVYTISGLATTGGLIRLNDVERVYFDGSFASSGRYLSFVNRSVSGSNAVFHLSGSSTGCRDVSIRNCLIRSDTSHVSSMAAVFIGGTTVGTGTSTQAGFSNKVIHIEGNQISKAYYGLLINGLATYPADSLYISGNDFGSDTLSSYIGACGIYARGCTRMTLSGNRIYNINNPYTYEIDGIKLMQDVYYTAIERNRIQDIINTSAGTSAVFGIYVNGNPGSNLFFRNNIISRVLGQGNASDISAGPVGLYINSGTHYRIINNTILLSGNRLNNTAGSAYTACLYVKGACSNVSVMNNVFKNVMTSANTVNVGSNFAIYTNASNANAFTALNNNLYYAASATSGVTSALGYMGAVKADLSAWRITSKLDKNSLWGDAGYVSDTVIYPNLSDTNCWNVNGRGFPQPDCSTDFSGNSRSIAVSTGATDIGAFEIVPAVPPRIALASATPVPGSTTYFTVGSDTVASIFWPLTSTIPTSVQVRYFSGSNPPATSTPYYFNAYWDVATVPSAGLNYTLALYYKPEILGTVENESNILMASREALTSWQYYTTGTVLDTVKEMVNVSGMGVQAIFTGTSITNPLPVKLVSFSGNLTEAGVVLHWTSSLEINSQMFVVERRESDSDKWLDVGMIGASGNSQIRQNYMFTDKMFIPDGNVFYRLRVIDRDGSEAWSPVIQLSNLNIRSLAEVNAFPNPFSDAIHVTYGQQLEPEIEIFDLNGKKVELNKTTWKKTPDGVLRIEGLNYLDAGVYLLYIQSAGETKVIKLIRN